MNNKPSIKFDDVSFCYVRTSQNIFRRGNTLNKKKEFWALKNVSFQINNNERVGLIGRNGSGKSSLARLCVGSLHPDKGELEVIGKKQLLALGVGFKPMMTGVENIYISASLLGLTTREIDEVLAEIVAFSGLKDFIHEPVRTYSSGMKSKLGFAVSTAVRPDILILDETLATGDAAFRKKALKRLHEMIGASGILVMISHNASQIRKMCERAIWIDNSRLVMDGDVKTVTKCYELFCNEEVRWEKAGRYPNANDL